jgi:YidC/Oxa1 family membrane protein insertase
MNVFDIVFVNPLTNFLLILYVFFGNNLGWAIIVFTIILRGAFLPLTIKQFQQQQKMAELQPKLQELQGKDPASLTAEERKIMTQTLGSFAGGCLPLLIQLPILIGLNFAIGNISNFNSNGEKSTEILEQVIYFDWLRDALGTNLTTTFYGFDLAGIPATIPHDIQTFWPYVLLIAVLVITQFIQSQIMINEQNKKLKKSDKKQANQKKLTKEEQEKKEMQEAMMKWTQMQTKYLIPVMIGIGSYSFAAGLGLYWFIQNILTILQLKVQYNWTEIKAFWSKTVNKEGKQTKEKNIELEEEQFLLEKPKKSKKNTKTKSKKKKSKKKKK